MRVHAFPDPEAFRTWLRTKHASVTELIVRCYKTKEAGTRVPLLRRAGTVDVEGRKR